MEKPNLKQLKSYFQSQFEGNTHYHGNSTFKNSELIFEVDGLEKLLSFQTRTSQQSLDQFKEKLELANQLKIPFIPIFLGGENNEFISHYSGHKQRIENCGENPENVWTVNNKIKYVSENQNGRIIVFNPKRQIIKMAHTSPVQAMSIIQNIQYLPNSEIQELMEQGKYQKKELSKALHFKKPAILETKDFLETLFSLN